MSYVLAQTATLRPGGVTGKTGVSPRRRVQVLEGKHREPAGRESSADTPGKHTPPSCWKILRQWNRRALDSSPPPLGKNSGQEHVRKELEGRDKDRANRVSQRQAQGKGERTEKG